MSFVLRLMVVVVNLSSVKCGIPLPSSRYNSLDKLACRIASASDSRVIYTYSGQIEDEYLVRCLSRSYVPIVTLTLSAIGVEKSRNTSSMHILTVGGDAEERLMQIERMLDPQMKQKYRRRYVVVFRVTWEEYLERVFKTFWASGVLHVVALCSQDHIYTYEPFANEGFRVVRLPPTIDSSKLFYDKLRNLHHYQLRISQFANPRSLPSDNFTQFGGIDGLVAMTTVERLNATVRFVVPSKDELYGYDVNGTLTGALRDVVKGVAHVGFNARNIDQRHAEYLQPTGKQMFFYLVVPKAQMAPQYLNFIRVFDRLTWLALVLTFFFVAVVFACLQKFVLKMPLPSEYVKFGARDILEMLFKTAIGDPVDGFHRISSLRQFLIAWILFSYVVASIYFAKMESVFVHPEYELDIDSLSELHRLKVPIYDNPKLLDLIAPSLDFKTNQIIASLHRPLPDDYEALLRRLVKTSNQNAFILRRDRAITLIARTYNNENKRPVYHMVKEYLMSLSYSYIVTGGSPFFEKFQTLNIRFFEHGLLEHFEDIQVNINNVRKDYLATEDDDDEEEDTGVGLKKKKRAIVLDMKILQGAFYTWVVGMGVGCLCFFVELCHQKWKRTDEIALQFEVEELRRSSLA